MKAISILSALVFAHAAFAQATDSTTAAAVSTTDSSTVDTATSSVLSSSTAAAATSTSSVADVSSSSSTSATATGTKGGKKSSSSSVPTATSSGNNAAPTSGGSIWEDGTTTLTSSDGKSPFVLSGVTTACANFLSEMNTDPAYAACLTPMSNALSAFTTSGSGDTNAVSKTLTSLCSLSNGPCSSVSKSSLVKFNDVCSGDFDSSKLLKQQYDMMYQLTRMKEALCTKNPDTQNYCVSDPGAASSKAKRSAIIHARDHLVNTWVKRGSSQTYFMPNTDTFRDRNILYGFASPDMTADELCTPCNQQIMSKYVGGNVPYALGQAQSPMGAGQIDLFKAMQDKCGSTFMAPIASAAGSPDASSGVSLVASGSTITAFAGALAALVALI